MKRTTKCHKLNIICICYVLIFEFELPLILFIFIQCVSIVFAYGCAEKQRKDIKNNFFLHKYFLSRNKLRCLNYLSQVTAISNFLLINLLLLFLHLLYQLFGVGTLLIKFPLRNPEFLIDWADPKYIFGHALYLEKY